MAYERLQRIVQMRGTKTNITGDAGTLEEGFIAYATDTSELGIYTNGVWVWIGVPALTLNGLTDVDTTGTSTGDIIYNNAGTWEDYPLGVGTNLVITSGKLRIGSSSNYLEIDKSTGNLRLVGSATQWDDIQPYYISGQGANVATTAQYGTTGFFWYKFTDTHAKDEELQFAFQIPHRAITAGTAHLHLHVVPSANGAGGNNTVVMRYSYQWVNINSTYSTTTNTAANVTFTVGASDANKHLLWDLVDISGTGKTLSSDLVVIISRQSKTESATDNYTGDIWLRYVDVHLEIDSFGSDEELVKDTSAALILESGDYLLLETGDKLLME